MFYYHDPIEGYVRTIIFDPFCGEIDFTSDTRFALEGDREFFQAIFKLLGLEFSSCYLVPVLDYE